ncbi:MAG: aspartyl protease family protein [Thiolinea sp.]
MSRWFGHWLLGVWLLVFGLAGCAGLPEPRPPHYEAGDVDTVVGLRLLHTSDQGVLPLVPVQLRGEQHWWLLDTGSSHNLITPLLAQQLQLPVVGGSELATIGGRRLSTHHRLPTLQIGRLRLEGQSATVADLSGLGGIIGASVSGILGMPALQDLVMELDMRRASLYLGRHLPRQSQQAAMTMLPFQLSGGVPVVSLTLPGKTRPGSFIVDTGNALPLVILPSYMQPGQRQRLTFVEMNDLGGTRATQLAQLPVLSLGGRYLEQVPVALPLSSQRLHAVDGSLGNGVLARQRVVFDFPQRQLWLADQGAGRRLAGGFGFMLAESSQITVVLQDGPAQQAGLQVGDRVVSVNGREVQGSGAHGVWEALYDQLQARLSVDRGGQLQQVLLQRGYYLPLLQP